MTAAQQSKLLALQFHYWKIMSGWCITIHDSKLRQIPNQELSPWKVIFLLSQIYCVHHTGLSFRPREFHKTSQNIVGSASDYCFFGASYPVFMIQSFVIYGQSMLSSHVCENVHKPKFHMYQLRSWVYIHVHTHELNMLCLWIWIMNVDTNKCTVKVW